MAKTVYGFTPENVRQRLGYLVVNTPHLWPLWLALVAGFGLAVTGSVLAFKVNRQVFAGARFEKFYRGTRLATAAALARETSERGKQQITIAGVPMPTEAETTHVSIGGATGTGKSTIVKEMIYAGMRRGDRMVITDPDGEFLSCFYRKGDKILNPYDARTEGWSFFNEIQEDYDFERRCCINRARSVDVYAQWSRGQPPIKSDSRVTA
ncbi:MAG: type IV secretion system DNA-binding domain-containing protein (plasmid) [Burkholderia sp.]